MPSSTSHHGSFDRGGRLAALWTGLLAGPIVWAVLLESNYSLSYVACAQASTWMLHLGTAIALVLVGAAAWLTWSAKPERNDDTAPSIDPERTGYLRARFMALGGLALCAWFALVILALEVPVLLLKPCNP